MASVPYMRIKTARVCRICGKSYEGVYGLCSRCNSRRTRAGYVGARGCARCGGVVSRIGSLCRKCFWAVYWKTAGELREKRHTVGEYRVEGIPAGY